MNDKRVDENGQRFRFTSKILPPYLRKTKAIEELVPWLYLKGISTSDFPEALAHLGHDGSGLSATTVVRLKEIWQVQHQDFSRRSLEGKRYVYVWVDGIYFNVRLTDDRPCVLVLMGATEDGTKPSRRSTASRRPTWTRSSRSRNSDAPRTNWSRRSWNSNPPSPPSGRTDHLRSNQPFPLPGP